MYIFAYTIRCYGNRQSLESRRRVRLAMSYESVHDAHEKNAAEGKTQKKTIGNLEKMTWDKEGLQKEVENYESGTFINKRNYIFEDLMLAMLYKVELKICLQS